MPAAVVALFAIAAAYEQEIFIRLGLTTWATLSAVFPYALQIGIWLSIAYLLTRIADVTLWDPISRRVSVPKLLRDVTKALIYILALAGIAGVVFKKPVGGFWAASGATGIVVGFALRNV